MFSREPTIYLGALSEVVRAIIPTLIIFGIIHWTSEQVAQFVLLVGVVVGALNVMLTRAQTTPEPVVNALIKEAIVSPAGTTVGQVKANVAEKDVQ